MIRIAAVYPREPGKSFNMEYYTETHLPIVWEKFSPYGLNKIEVDKPYESPGGKPSPCFAIGYLYFPSWADFRKAYASVGHEVIADISKYTDVFPMIQVGEIQSVKKI